MLPGEIALDGVGLDLDPRVLAITLALALVTAVLSGLWPALRAATPSAHVLLRARGAGRRRSPPRLLIAGQVALTLVLLVGAALFVRSLRAGLTTDFGFEASRLATVSMDLFRYGYDSARARVYYDDALAGAASLPGVTGVALTTHVPLTPLGTLPFDTADGPYTVEQPLRAGNARVTADYFDVMGMPVVSGRTFDESDLRGSVIPAILNESAARALFGETSPLGRAFRMFGRRESMVVGVVRDANVAGARDRGAPVVYQPLLREIPTGGVSLIVRSDAPAAALGAARQLLLGIDPGVAVHDARLLADLVDRALMPQRLGSLLLSLFAAIALAVAAVGIYSVVAFTVSQRTAELGIRVALGAQGGDVLRVVLGRSWLAVAAGALFGAAAAVPASGALGRFLYDIQPLDRLSFVAAGALLVLAAIAAMILPARRAMRTDPLIALRNE
jgi:predicted permease